MSIRFTLVIAATPMTGGSAIAARTDSLGGERILSPSTGTMGVRPGTLSLIDRRSEGSASTPA